MTPQPRHMIRPLAAVAAMLLLAPGLVGCSLEIVENGRSVPPTNSQGSEPDGEAPPIEDGLDRSAFDKLPSATLSCESGTLDVDSAGAVVKVQDDCAELEVSATGAVVLAGSVGAVTVSGTGNTVFVQDAESVELTGTGNTVVWESGAPKVTDTGITNVAVPSQG